MDIDAYFAFPSLCHPAQSYLVIPLSLHLGLLLWGGREPTHCGLLASQLLFPYCCRGSWWWTMPLLSLCHATSVSFADVCGLVLVSRNNFTLEGTENIPQLCLVPQMLVWIWFYGSSHEVISWIGTHLIWSLLHSRIIIPCTWSHSSQLVNV